MVVPPPPIFILSLVSKLTPFRIFWINLPFAGIGFILTPIFLKLNQRVESIWQKLARIDYVGTFLFISSMTSVLIPISWGGVMYSWSHWRTLVPLLLGFAGIVAFMVWEIMFAKEPMVPLRVFKTRTAASAYIGTFIHGIIVCHPHPSSLPRADKNSSGQYFTTSPSTSKPSNTNPRSWPVSPSSHKPSL